MSRLQLIFAVVTLGIPSISAAEWYSIRGTGKPAKTIRGEAHGKTFELPLYKLDLQATALVLRRDTERADYYWLETTLTEQRDSGDGYFLAFGDVVLGEIYTRGNKWAIGFTSIDDARRCFRHLRELHRLDADHARDTTKA